MTNSNELDSRYLNTIKEFDDATLIIHLEASGKITFSSQGNDLVIHKMAEFMAEVFNMKITKQIEDHVYSKED